MMGRFKKIVKIISLVFVILVASAGVGISGGVPMLSMNKKEEKVLHSIEFLDAIKDNQESELLDVFE